VWQDARESFIRSEEIAEQARDPPGMEEFVAAELPVMAILSYPQPFVGTENSISFFPHSGAAGQTAISAIRYRFRRSARLSRWMSGDAKTSEVAGLRNSCLPVTALLFLTGLDYPYFSDQALCGTLHAIEDVTESDLSVIRKYETSLLSQYRHLQQDPAETRAAYATARAAATASSSRVNQNQNQNRTTTHFDTQDMSTEHLMGTDLLEGFHHLPPFAAETLRKPPRRRDCVELVGRWECDVCQSLMLIDHSECIKCALTRSRKELGTDALYNGRKNNSPVLDLDRNLDPDPDLDLQPDSISNDTMPVGGNIDLDQFIGASEGPQTPDSIIPGQPDFSEFVSLSGKGKNF
jgi:hypothetical protein